MYSIFWLCTSKLSHITTNSESSVWGSNVISFKANKFKSINPEWGGGGGGKGQIIYMDMRWVNAITTEYQIALTYHFTYGRHVWWWIKTSDTIHKQDTLKNIQLQFEGIWSSSFKGEVSWNRYPDRRRWTLSDRISSYGAPLGCGELKTTF